MNDCHNKKCVNGMSSSNCIEYDENFTVENKIKTIDEKLITIDDLFKKSIDGKTLATGQDLIKTVQKLVDDSIKQKNNVLNTTESTSTNLFNNVDVSCLLGTECNTVLTQEEIIKLLVKEVCFLKSKLINIPTNY